jgi:hypothetical protein
MYDPFMKRVRGAAVAGWWMVLTAYCILLIQWFAYVPIMARQPAGVLCIWGAGATWSEVRTVWLWAMVAFKLGVGMMLLVVIWLTPWARQLSRPKE